MPARSRHQCAIRPAGGPIGQPGARMRPSQRATLCVRPSQRRIRLSLLPCRPPADRASGAILAGLAGILPAGLDCRPPFGAAELVSAGLDCLAPAVPIARRSPGSRARARAGRHPDQEHSSVRRQLHTTAHDCTHLLRTAQFFSSLHRTAQSCSGFLDSAHDCTVVHASAHPCIVREGAPRQARLSVGWDSSIFFWEIFGEQP